MERKVLPVIIGTGGHVDHGKTSLVKQLTGRDTDRLAEEKRRGMSIDISVAPIEFPSGEVAGIVDVPGHEDFIRNMVAGASSIDILLLIVAADDGIMPQTDEHALICRLLGASIAVPVITKIDRVSVERIEEVKAEINMLLDRLNIAGTSISLVNNLTGEGIDKLRESLLTVLSSAERKPDIRSFRVDVRHAFSAKGFGTVVTGIPAAGAIKVGDECELLPAGVRTTVRSIQSYGQNTNSAAAHISCAINLRDLPTDIFSRGMTLAEPDIYVPTQRCIVSLELVENLPKQSKRQRFMFYHGTHKSLARVRILESKVFLSETAKLATLTLQSPHVLASGDRFILRSFDSNRTVAGGRIISTEPVRRRLSPERMHTIHKAAAACASGRFDLAALLSRDSAIITAPSLSRIFQSNIAHSIRLAAELVESGDLTPLSEDAWIVTSRINEISSSVTKILKRYHHEHPQSLGLEISQLGEKLKIPARSASILMAKMKGVSVSNGRASLETFSPLFSEKELQNLGRCREIIRCPNAKSISHLELQERLGVSELELKKCIKTLSLSKEIVTFDNQIISWGFFEECRSAITDICSKQKLADLKSFREATGLSRNIAVGILDMFDSIGFTTRIGEGRILRVQRDAP